MGTSTRQTRHVGSAIGKLVMALAVALVIGGISVGPALANHEGREWREREWREREWREHRWREHRWHERYRPYGYAPPPVVYEPAPVYTPPPVVYAPPPPPPGITFVFPFRIR